MNRGIRLPLLLALAATASLFQFVLALPDEGTGTNTQTNAGLSAGSRLASFAAARSTRFSELTTSGQAALQCDGLQNYASVSNNDALTPQGPFTVESWVLFIDIAPFFVGNMDVLQQSGWWLGLSDPDNTLYVNTGFSSYGNAQIFGVTTVNDGAWHHVAGVYDGTNLVLYVDGVPEAELEIGEDTLAMNGQ